MCAFFRSQFSNCPLARTELSITPNRNLYSKIHRFHERCLRAVYNEEKPSFQKLIDQAKSIPVDTRNLESMELRLIGIKLGTKHVIY